MLWQKGMISVNYSSHLLQGGNIFKGAAIPSGKQLDAAITQLLRRMLWTESEICAYVETYSFFKLIVRLLRKCTVPPQEPAMESEDLTMDVFKLSPELKGVEMFLCCEWEKTRLSLFFLRGSKGLRWFKYMGRNARVTIIRFRSFFLITVPAMSFSQRKTSSATSSGLLSLMSFTVMFTFTNDSRPTEDRLRRRRVMRMSVQNGWTGCG